LPLHVAPKAEKDLRRIGPGPMLDRIEQTLAGIDDVAPIDGPGAVPSTKRLHGTDVPTWRTRVGDYRVLWTMDPHGPLVIRIVHRSDLDQVIKRL